MEREGEREREGGRERERESLFFPSSTFLSFLTFFFSLPLSPNANQPTSYVYSHNTGLQAQSVMYTVASSGGDEKPVVLLDPNKLSEDGTVSRETRSSFFFSFSFPTSLPLSRSRKTMNTVKKITARSLWGAPLSATTAR